MAGEIPESWGKGWGQFKYQSLVPEADGSHTTLAAKRISHWLHKNCVGCHAWVSLRGQREALIFAQERDAILFEMFREAICRGDFVDE